MPSDISRRADSPLKCRFQIKSNPPDAASAGARFAQVQARCILALPRSRNFIMKSKPPRGNTLCVKRPLRRQFFLLLENHRRLHRPAITTVFGTFTTAGFSPSHRTLLMIIIKDFLHVDPEFSARRDSARVRNADKIYHPRCISFPIEKYTEVFSLISRHFPPEDRRPAIVNHWRISNVPWRKSLQSREAFQIILSWRKMWRVISSSGSIRRRVISFSLNVHFKYNS